jgi:hypothetical protein
MIMRGIKKPGSALVTSALRVFPEPHSHTQRVLLFAPGEVKCQTPNFWGFPLKIRGMSCPNNNHNQNTNDYYLSIAIGFIF